MPRVLAILSCGLAIAGCTASGDLMKTATPTVPMQFESDPPGAEVRTSGGQTCRTPCALAVPAADFQVTYNLNGYQPQTVPVKLLPPDDIRGSEESGLTFTPPRFNPSPVVAELVKAAPRRGPAKKAPVAKRPPRTQMAEPDLEPPPARPSSSSGFTAPPPANSGGFGPPARSPAASSWPTPGSQVR